MTDFEAIRSRLGSRRLATIPPPSNGSGRRAGRREGTNVADPRDGARPFYALMMFPYPSAEGLHVGNLFAFTGNDIYGRFQRLQGHTVFEPIGYDAFGIHSENYAIKVGVHPARPHSAEHRELPAAAEARRPDGRLGARALDHRSRTTTSGRSGSSCSCSSRGWRTRRRRRSTGARTTRRCSPTSRSSAARASAAARWSSSGFLEQWFFRISDYAERLLANLDRLDWSETHEDRAAELDRPVGRRGDRVPRAGRDGVRRSATATGSRRVTRPPLEIRVFTTRPDTVFGATYLVLAPEHPLVGRDHDRRPARARSSAYSRARRSRTSSRARRRNEKTGVFTGAYAINPATRKADSDLDRRLRADGVRHRRDHGRAGPRRARLRVRDESSGCRSCASWLAPSRRARTRRWTSAFVETDDGRWSTPAGSTG